MADLLGKDINCLKDTQGNEDVKKSRKQHVNKMKVSKKRLKTLKETRKKSWS